MRTKRTPDEWADWCIAKNQIAEVLKEYYQACTAGELPPQLLTLLKKLDDELSQQKVSSPHEARRIAANIAKLPGASAEGLSVAREFSPPAIL